MSIVLTEEQISRIVKNLRGTAGNLDLEVEALLGDGHDAGDISNESADAIDREIFLCGQCGWWHDQDEMSDIEFQSCIECAGDSIEVQPDGYEEEPNEDLDTPEEF